MFQGGLRAFSPLSNLHSFCVFAASEHNTKRERVSLVFFKKKKQFLLAKNSIRGSLLIYFNFKAIYILWKPFYFIFLNKIQPTPHRVSKLNS
jgi:hypothetical protein